MMIRNMNKNNAVVILGTAHLSTTPGKRSPDGKFREAEFSRLIVRDLKTKLEAYGFKVFVDYLPLTPSQDMMIGNTVTQNRELLYRVKVVNDVCKRYGPKNCAYVSIHVNAASNDGKWHTATGWEAYTSVGKTNADRLADCLYESAKKNLIGKKIRTDWSDGDIDKESNFYVVKHTICPAVLTENFFQDTKSDVAYMQSEEGVHAIVRTHLEGIIKYFERL